MSIVFEVYTSSDVLKQCRICASHSSMYLELGDPPFDLNNIRIGCLCDDTSDKDDMRTNWGLPADVISEWNEMNGGGE